AGYFLFGQSNAPHQEEQTTDVNETNEKDQEEAEDLANAIPEEAEVLSRNGCLGCHSVESMNAVGGDVGPDLSRAYPEMKSKHGKELDDFLQEPTSAVMSTIIADKPLDEKERKQIVKVLKDASEKLKSSSNPADSEQRD